MEYPLIGEELGARSTLPRCNQGWTLSSGCRLKTMNPGSVAETDGPC